jgi:hypothetical protein
LPRPLHWTRSGYRHPARFHSNASAATTADRLASMRDKVGVTREDHPLSRRPSPALSLQLPETATIEVQYAPRLGFRRVAYPGRAYFDYETGESFWISG